MDANPIKFDDIDEIYRYPTEIFHLSNNNYYENYVWSNATINWLSGGEFNVLGNLKGLFTFLKKSFSKNDVLFEDALKSTYEFSFFKPPHNKFIFNDNRAF